MLLTIFILLLQTEKLITQKERKNMIIIPVKSGESIERALKKYKRKYEKTGVVKEIRARQQFDKPSIINREQKLKAIYVQQLRDKAEI